MVLNYYSILSKAIRGKDAAARLSLYDEARALVARLRVGPNHTEEDISAQSDALESAISQIEADVAASYREETGTERLDSVLSSGPSWGRIAATVLAVIANNGKSDDRDCGRANQQSKDTRDGRLNDPFERPGVRWQCVSRDFGGGVDRRAD